MTSLIGCAASKSPSTDVPLSATWKMDEFRVQFQAGPKGAEGKLYSYYEIGHMTADRQERSLVMESAHSIEGFQCVTNGLPKNWIRMIEDSRHNAFLIEEQIPNECGPCSNYLWLCLDSDGFIKGKYLQLPSKVMGATGGIDYEYPKVRSLEGEVLKYEYSNGACVTERIDLIGKADHPTLP